MTRSGTETFSAVSGERRYRAVAIGGSAGAVDALSGLLPKLSADFPVPILIVVHIPPRHDSILAQLFGDKCQLSVKEAEDKETLAAGTIYFAPPNYHLLVEQDGRVSLSSDEPILFSRPSIDVLFESAADVYGDGLVGIILTGANSDGANGIRAVCAGGGLGIVERPDLAYVPTMPRAALEACPDAECLTIEQIAEFLKSLVPISH